MIVIPQRVIENGSVISLRGDSGNYMSRMGATGLELSKGSIDQYCKFKVVLVQIGTDKKLALQGDNGKFMSRMGPRAWSCQGQHRPVLPVRLRHRYGQRPDIPAWRQRQVDVADGREGLGAVKDGIDRFSQFMLVLEG